MLEQRTTSDSRGLQTIFSFFLGLMVTAFIGLGIYTFYPPPAEGFEPRLEELSREERDVTQARPDAELTDRDRTQLTEINQERDQIYDMIREDSEVWGRMTSIALILFATIAMAVSLIRAEQLPVVGNGLLMGGLFTMVYGVGWIIATDTSVARFVVMAAALVITLGLGWLRFVRSRTSAPPPSGSLDSDRSVNVDGLEERVARLEERVKEAARSLAGEE